MVSRRVLLGMVAVLGISIPSWPEMKYVVGSVRFWTVEQLADWDTWRPIENVIDSVPEVSAPLQPETVLLVARPSDQRPVASGSSIVSGRSAAIRSMRLGGRCECRARRMSRGRTPDRCVDERRAQEARTRCDPHALGDGLSLRPERHPIELRAGPGDLCRMADGAGADPTIPDHHPDRSRCGSRRTG